MKIAETIPRTPTAVLRRKQEAVIPLERPPKREFEKGDCETLRLYTDPANTESASYDIVIPYYGSGTPEEFLKFQADLKKVFTGQNLTTGPKRFIMARRLLKGDALATFNAAAEKQTSETVDSFEACMKELTAHVFPAQAAQMQKRWMRRYMRKPKEVCAREHINRVKEINEYLTQFPDPREGVASEKIGEDELKDILDFGNPRSWQKQMILQGFDPIEKSMKEFTDFCERLERTQELEPNQPDVQVAGRKSKKAKLQHNSNNNKSSNEKFYCAVHGKNSTHSTAECKAIQSAKKTVEDRKKESSKKETNKKYSKSELNNLAKAHAKRMIKSIAAKKKKEESSDDEDLYNFDKHVKLEHADPEVNDIKTDFHRFT